MSEEGYKPSEEEIRNAEGMVDYSHNVELRESLLAAVESSGESAGLTKEEIKEVSDTFRRVPPNRIGEYVSYKLKGLNIVEQRKYLDLHYGVMFIEDISLSREEAEKYGEKYGEFIMAVEKMVSLDYYTKSFQHNDLETSDQKEVLNGYIEKLL